MPFRGQQNAAFGWGQASLAPKAGNVFTGSHSEMDLQEVAAGWVHGGAGPVSQGRSTQLREGQQLY